MIGTVEVQFPSGNVRTVNMLRLLVQAQNAEFKAKHGMFLPGVGKLHPTVRALREEYELPSNVRTWSQAAFMIRRLHTDLTAAIRAEESPIERELRFDEERIDAEMTAAELRGITAPDF